MRKRRTLRINNTRVICSETQLLRVTCISFHSLVTKNIRHTLTASIFEGRGFSQSIMKTSMLHWVQIMDRMLTVY